MGELILPLSRFNREWEVIKPLDKTDLAAYQAIFRISHRFLLHYPKEVDKIISNHRHSWKLFAS